MENQSEAKQGKGGIHDAAPSWFIVRSATRREQAALESLRQHGFDAYCPMLKRWAYKARQGKVRVERPLFDGYLFVDVMLGGEARFDLVRSADGVHAFLKREGAPASIPAAEVAGLRRREAAGDFDKTKVRRASGPFNSGDRVAIIAGKFTDWPALVVEMRGADRVRLLLEAFGRTHEKVLPVANLRVA